jgi:carbon starvation protein
MQDGNDYVPTPTPVLFSHHYATIAGAGPIVGPTIAAVYGLWPAFLWVVFGAVFFGAVHDYTSMFVSLRERGRTVAEITGSVTGRLGFILYICFTLVLIILVTGAFLDLSVVALTSVASTDLLQLPAANPFGWEVTGSAGGAPEVRIGGIATMSVIIITLLAPLMGLAIHRFKVNVRIIAVVAVLIALGSVWFGLYHPVSFGAMDPNTVRILWMAVLAVYVLLASALPVWMILQPRDFVNAFTLYGGMALLLTACIVGGMRGMATDTAMGWTVAGGTAKLGFIFPVLFITIACGAISGFHSLVSSGTSSKQANKEGDAKRIGFGGMLTEGLLAVLVLVAIGAGLTMTGYMNVQWPATGAGNPVLSFALGAGLLANKALGIPVYLGTIFGLLMVEGFLVTTLDTAVRLNRYLFEELWNFIWPSGVPALLRNHYFNAGLAAVAMLAIAYPNGWKIIWPVFGTANQLMAALTLATVSIWLAFRLRPSWFTLVPAIFMMATCLTSLYQLLSAHPGKLAAAAEKLASGALDQAAYNMAVVSAWSVFVLSLLLALLSLGVVWIAVTKLYEVYSGKREPILTDASDAYAEPAVQHSPGG